MKKAQRIIIYTGLALLTAFVSCKKDETKTDTTTTTENVKLTVTVVDPAASFSVPAKDYIVVHVVATGNTGNALKNLYGSMKITTPGGVFTGGDTTALTGTSYESYDTITLDFNSSSYELSAILVGEKGTPATFGPVTYYTNTIDSNATSLGNQADSKAKFWSARLKGSYYLKDVKGSASMQGDMDFAYLTRSVANGGNKLISPSSQDATDIYADQWSAADEKITTWSVRNTTGFIKVNSVINLSTFNTYSLSTDSLIGIAKSVGEPSNPYVTVVDGDIYLYRTVRGAGNHKSYYYGLIYVSGPTGSVVGSTAVAGDVTLLIRYQREH
jgi:hypothetical protein